MRVKKKKTESLHAFGNERGNQSERARRRARVTETGTETETESTSHMGEGVMGYPDHGDLLINESLLRLQLLCQFVRARLMLVHLL
jgi:hypothetical protein